MAPGRLRATVRQAGLDWVEDPSNTDMAFTRARVRAELQALAGTKLAVVPARVRQAEERAAAAALAGRATLYPEGYAVLTPGPIAPAALARLLRMLAGRDFEPSRAAVAGLAGGLRPATLGGVRVMAAGRLGPGWLLVRESAAMAAPVAAVAGAVWDGRFRLTRDVPGAMLGALGSDAAGFRGRGLPGAVAADDPGFTAGLRSFRRSICCLRWPRRAEFGNFYQPLYGAGLWCGVPGVKVQGACEGAGVGRLGVKLLVGDAERGRCSHVVNAAAGSPGRGKDVWVWAAFGGPGLSLVDQGT